MPSIDDIEVVPGSDPEFLAYAGNPDFTGDVTGFNRYGYSEANVQALCAFIREICIELRQHIPPELLEHMPQKYEVYGDQAGHGVRASVHYGRPHDQDPGQLKEFRGLSIGSK